MSIVTALAKQNLIAQRNNLQYQMLQNYSMQRSMLQNPFFMGNMEATSMMETNLALNNIDNSTQLMAINAELSALDNARLNYLA